ncbi:unnamed protein product [Rotaria sordida]|uniref:Uncharacterized protein n=1 Tax=Rotaria sordida TaxID=392033 RepID=A0A813MLG0_9BILA|nr:unnamed protein product [Rotaria sordida]CAF0759650.1 unnamed protein product [Rotaria sordida]CAF0775979.1 unnamed protein product [Rotaria sordida]CAF0797501.1 unnamed protein product [Rotaria sordida]CAF0799869.1 unnamed protein product [Rotaria sordida]
MPISYKRTRSQRKINHHQQQQQRESVPQNNENDNYIYYPYYSKTTPNNGYEYVQEPDQYEDRRAQYNATYTNNNSASVRRT